MFPWIFGFEWTPGTAIFLGIFYSVALIVLATVMTAVWRGARHVRARSVEAIAWHGEFDDLPLAERHCRHDFTGEMPGRVCPRAFDCTACENHARVAQAHPRQTSAEVDDSLGLSIPLDRFYHRGHTWVREESDGTLAIGLDELARRVVVGHARTELPAPGSRLTRNGTAWRVLVHGGVFRILSPVDGEVIAAGRDGDDWTLRVRPAPGFSLAHLLRGEEVIHWLGREMERVQLAVSASTGAEPALADGGVPVDDFVQACPAADWRSVCGAMFLEN